MRSAVAAVILACSIPCFPDVSRFETAETLLPDCKAAVRQWDRGDVLLDAHAMHCVGYVKGTFDAEEVIRSLQANEGVKKPIVRHCVPEDATIVQLVKVFVKYADDHPEELNYPASVVFHNALNKAFKCR